MRSLWNLIIFSLPALKDSNQFYLTQFFGFQVVKTLVLKNKNGLRDRLPFKDKLVTLFTVHNSAIHTYRLYICIAEFELLFIILQSKKSISVIIRKLTNN